MKGFRVAGGCWISCKSSLIGIQVDIKRMGEREVWMS